MRVRRAGAESLLVAALAALGAVGAVAASESFGDDEFDYIPLPPPATGLVDNKGWSRITFDFEGSPNSEEQLRATGEYDPVAIVPIDVEAVGDRLFVTTTSFMRGTPATLSTVSLSSGQADQPLRPYPSWSEHATTNNSVTDCSRQIISVFRTTRIPSDENVLYAIDCGIIEFSTTRQVMCPPKVIQFDLVNNSIRNVTEVAEKGCNSFYNTIMVEELDSGARVAYVSDVTAYVLTVVDLDNGRRHSVTSQYFYPSPGFGVTTIGGKRSFLMDGLFGLALDRRYKRIYTAAFASDILGRISTAELREFYDGDVIDLSMEVALHGWRAGPSGAMAVDDSGRRLFFGIAEEEALYCWDTNKPYEQRYFRPLAHDFERLQFFSGVKLQLDGQRLWVLTCRFNKYVDGELRDDEVNFRIMYYNVSQITC